MEKWKKIKRKETKDKRWWEWRK